MKNLVIVPFGNDSLESPWIFDDANRRFDVVLLFYHDQIDKAKLKVHNPAFRLFQLMDFKWIMVHNFFKQHADYLNNYDFFFFPDDDIEIEKKTVDLLFDLMKEYSLQMAQPVLSYGSNKSWKVLVRKYFSGIRYLSSVELMCPAFSKKAVAELLPTFTLNKSGWGIDIVWGEIIRKKYGQKSIGVFDLLVATHKKPVGSGELYSKLGKPASEERDEIFRDFSIIQTTIYQIPVVENGLLNRIMSYFALKKQIKRLEGKDY